MGGAPEGAKEAKESPEKQPTTVVNHRSFEKEKQRRALSRSFSLPKLHSSKGCEESGEFGEFEPAEKEEKEKKEENYQQKEPEEEGAKKGHKRGPKLGSKVSERRRGESRESGTVCGLQDELFGRPERRRFSAGVCDRETLKAPICSKTHTRSAAAQLAAQDWPSATSGRHLKCGSRRAERRQGGSPARRRSRKGKEQQRSKLEEGKSACYEPLWFSAGKTSEQPLHSTAPEDSLSTSLATLRSRSDAKNSFATETDWARLSSAQLGPAGRKLETTSASKSLSMASGKSAREGGLGGELASRELEFEPEAEAEVDLGERGRRTEASGAGERACSLCNYLLSIRSIAAENELGRVQPTGTKSRAKRAALAEYHAGADEGQPAGPKSGLPRAEVCGPEGATEKVSEREEVELVGETPLQLQGDHKDAGGQRGARTRGRKGRGWLAGGRAGWRGYSLDEKEAKRASQEERTQAQRLRQEDSLRAGKCHELPAGKRKSCTAQIVSSLAGQRRMSNAAAGNCLQGRLIVINSNNVSYTIRGKCSAS